MTRIYISNLIHTRFFKLLDTKLITSSEKLLSLPKSDLNSLLLKVFQEQANNTTPVDVLKAFQTNRFSVPGDIDPVSYHVFEAELLSLAQKLEIKTLLLSPSAPFASCSAFDCLDQNNIVRATRGTEILSDPTNMLSIIISGIDIDSIMFFRDLKRHKKNTEK